MLRAAHGRPVGGGRPVLQSNIFDFYMCTLSITPRFRHPPPQVPRFRVPRLARCGGRGSGGSRFRVPALPRASGVGSQRTKGVLNCGQVPRFQVPRGGRNPVRGRTCYLLHKTTRSVHPLALVRAMSSALFIEQQLRVQSARDAFLFDRLEVPAHEPPEC